MNRTLIRDLPQTASREEISTIKGWVHNIRDKGRIVFLEVRDRTAAIQVVIDNSEGMQTTLRRYDIVSLEGRARQAPVRSGTPGFEFQAQGLEVISSPQQDYPIPITQKAQNKPETELEYRVLSVRNPRNNLLFRLQAGIARHFEEYLQAEGFVRIFSPKIVPQVAESGANTFRLDYFGRAAFLTQSPQLYKQIMVGSGLERVFEIGPVFRAEKHNTSRHLNEYTSLDLEMGFIDSFQDLLDLEESMIRYIFGKVQQDFGDEIKEAFGSEIQMPGAIPRIPLAEAIAIVKREFNYSPPDERDIDPNSEKRITDYVQREFGSDLVFLTHYPAEKRPFYVMPTPGNPSLTESFDLIYRGLEITTGGQRIHDYNQLIASMQRFGIAQQGFEKYLDAFKFGMPPHGGMALGLERVTARILGLDNVKLATLFPRDRNRLEP